MPDAIVFEAFGVTAELTVDDPASLATARAVLPPGWIPGRPDAVGARFRLAADGSVLVDGRQARRGMPGGIDLLDAVVRSRIGQLAADYVFVHAGAVAVGGDAVVVPGHSLSGKTTLVAALVATGAEYLSDEFAVLDGDGRVHPYPKPLSLREDGGFAQRDVAVEELGGIAGDRALVARLVVVTRFERGARWAPARRTAAEGAMALLEHALPARARPAQALTAARRAAEGAAVLAGPRGEAEEAARAIVEAVSEARSPL